MIDVTHSRENNLCRYRISLYSVAGPYIAYVSYLMCISPAHMYIFKQSRAKAFDFHLGVHPAQLHSVSYRLYHDCPLPAALMLSELFWAQLTLIKISEHIAPGPGIHSCAHSIKQRCSFQHILLSFTNDCHHKSPLNLVCAASALRNLNSFHQDCVVYGGIHACWHARPRLQYCLFSPCIK